LKDFKLTYQIIIMVNCHKVLETVFIVKKPKVGALHAKGLDELELLTVLIVRLKEDVGSAVPDILGLKVIRIK
jgi:hypothetical protein